MLDEQQDTTDAPEGAVSAETLKNIPGPPKVSDEELAGPRAAAAERARQAAEAGAAAAACETER
jgi:hypothetical protein